MEFLKEYKISSNRIQYLTFFYLNLMTPSVQWILTETSFSRHFQQYYTLFCSYFLLRHQDTSIFAQTIKKRPSVFAQLNEWVIFFFLWISSAIVKCLEITYLVQKSCIIQLSISTNTREMHFFKCSKPWKPVKSCVFFFFFRFFTYFLYIDRQIY